MKNTGFLDGFKAMCDQLALERRVMKKLAQYVYSSETDPNKIRQEYESNPALQAMYGSFDDYYNANFSNGSAGPEQMPPVEPVWSNSGQVQSPMASPPSIASPITSTPPSTTPAVPTQPPKPAAQPAARQQVTTAPSFASETAPEYGLEASPGYVAPGQTPAQQNAIRQTPPAANPKLVAPAANPKPVAPAAPPQKPVAQTTTRPTTRPQARGATATQQSSQSAPGIRVNNNTTINSKPVEYRNYSDETWGSNGASFGAMREMYNQNPEGMKTYLENAGVGKNDLGTMTPQQRNQLASNYYASLSSEQKSQLQGTDAFKRLNAQNKQQALNNSMEEWDRRQNKGVNFNEKGIATNTQKTPQQIAAEKAEKSYNDYNVNNQGSSIHSNIATGVGEEGPGGISDIVDTNRKLYNEQQKANQTLVQERAKQRQVRQANRADAGGGSGGTFSYKDPRTGQTYENLSMADWRRMKSVQNNQNHPGARIRA